MLAPSPVLILFAALAPVGMFFATKGAGSKAFEFALALLMLCLAACASDGPGILAWSSSLTADYPHTFLEMLQAVLAHCLELGVRLLVAITVRVPGWLIAVLGVGFSVTVKIGRRPRARAA